ncbi:hypothetical protein [Aeromonas hydrophila]|uniref:hypothetical protein n=1 Tax=Aeromonas hydrophila TaxID=644 RepID=UPI0038D1DC6A
MKIEITCRINEHLDTLYQEAVDLSTHEDEWQLYQKAGKIPGLDFLIKNRGSKYFVANQDSLKVMDWIYSKTSSENNLSLDEVKGLFFIIGIAFEHFYFWKSCATSEMKINNAFIHYAKLIIDSSSSETEFKALTTYHEEERKSYIRKIIAENNWSKIYNEFHRHYENFKYEISYFITSAFFLLFHFNEKSLMSILDTRRDIPIMWAMMSQIEKCEAMHIALKTTNQSLKFSAIASALPFPERSNLTNIEAKKLTDIFLDLTMDDNLWQHWMKILNTYPSRYPHIQLSLGTALAKTTSRSAIETYFKAVHLYTADMHDKGRKTISECLDIFSLHATQESKAIAWKYAYEIWIDWCFDVKKKDGFLFEIRGCCLDYAVTRYYLELIEPKQLKNIIEDLYDKIQNIDNVWHETSSKYTTYWYLQHSKLQPIYHAEEIHKNNSLPYLMEGIYYKHDYGKFEDYIKHMIQ